jgi:hypothetical protein
MLNAFAMRAGVVGVVVGVAVVLGCVNSGRRGNAAFDVVKIGVGNGAGSVEVGDFNKDGFSDLVVANAKDSSVTILLGNGKGKFAASSRSPFFANRSPNDIVIADFNKDKNPDLGIANTEASLLTVLLGNGAGQFRQVEKSPFAVHSKPHTHGIATGDFNGDGNLDLVSDSWGENRILIVFGDGRGNFGEETFYPVGKHPYQRARASDLNHDGRQDIVTTNLDGKNVTVLLGKGNGKFDEAPGSPVPAGDSPFGLAIGDVNGDGHADLAVVDAPTITSDGTGKDGLTILLGDGRGKFQPMKGSPFAAGKSPSRIAIGDINGDGINDIAVTNYNSESITLFYMSRNGVAESSTIPSGGHPDGIAIHDLNRDGRNDIAVSNFDDNAVVVFFRK